MIPPPSRVRMFRVAQGVVVTRSRAEREECSVWAILRVEAVWAMGFAARLGSGLVSSVVVSLFAAGSGGIEDVVVFSGSGSGSAIDTRLDIRRTFGGRFTERRAEWLVLRAGGRGRSRSRDGESEECCSCRRRGLTAFSSVILFGVLYSESIFTVSRPLVFNDA